MRRKKWSRALSWAVTMELEEPSEVILLEYRFAGLPVSEEISPLGQAHDKPAVMSAPAVDSDGSIS
jgi:hypothetical protein